MATKNLRPEPVVPPAAENHNPLNPDVQQRRDMAATLVAALSSRKLESMSAHELLKWLRDNNRVGYSNLVRALFEISA